MNNDTLFFFDKRMNALPLYEALEREIFAQIPDVKVKVSKTQISFSQEHIFALVSFTPCRKAVDRPQNWITVSFGLNERKASPRIDVATEPYPGRWTHHVMVGSCAEIDDELMRWIREAAVFSAGKR